jgi:hypothetical protein
MKSYILVSTWRRVQFNVIAETRGKHTDALSQSAADGTAGGAAATDDDAAAPYGISMSAMSGIIARGCAFGTARVGLARAKPRTKKENCFIENPRPMCVEDKARYCLPRLIVGR